jgi:endonuclease YncB( thermonuclease family)
MARGGKTPEDPARLYRALMRRHRRYMLQKYLRRYGLPALAAMASCAPVWAFLSFESLPSLAPSAPAEVKVWRPGRGETADFRLCGWGGGPNCVVDGDTIHHGGVKIRLADIDTPEISSLKCASERALGEKAKDRLLELMNAGPFELVRYSGDEDQYGRKLRVIKRDGRSVGDTLIAEGLARRWDGARRSWC